MSGNGGSAFPLPLGSETVDGADGMTLRDYFAAKAMQGMVTRGVPSGDIPLYAYEIADAMISVRSMQNDQQKSSIDVWGAMGSNN